jgi:hypothetical protein
MSEWEREREKERKKNPQRIVSIILNEPLKCKTTI